MVKRMTQARKEQLFDEHKALLYFFYEYGHGIMLRQQLVNLLARLTDKYEVEIEVALSLLIQSGLLGSSRAFSNSRHTVITMKKYVLSIFTEKSSRDCHAVNLSPNTILYSMYKTELLLSYLDDDDLIWTPVSLRKNQAEELHSRYGEYVNTTQNYQYKKDNFHSKEQDFFNKDDIFNFNHFLASNFLLKGVYEQNGENVLQLFYLDTNCVTVKKFYSLVGNVIKMFDRYTETKLARVEICMLFHNRAEMYSFKHGWSQKTFFNKLIEKRVNPCLADCSHIILGSLDLDRKYHIYRELA